MDTLVLPFSILGPCGFESVCLCSLEPCVRVRAPPLLPANSDTEIYFRATKKSMTEPITSLLLSPLLGHVEGIGKPAALFYLIHMHGRTCAIV